VEALPIDRGCRISASIGATVFSEPPASVEAALHEADVHLYEAKASGKNRVKLALTSGTQPAELTLSVSTEGR
jgi:GGDEF domain-containing protein